jgi:hypothetical protein
MMPESINAFLDRRSHLQESLMGKHTGIGRLLGHDARNARHVS